MRRRAISLLSVTAYDWHWKPLQKATKMQVNKQSAKYPKHTEPNVAFSPSPSVRLCLGLHYRYFVSWRRTKKLRICEKEYVCFETLRLLQMVGIKMGGLWRKNRQRCDTAKRAEKYTRLETLSSRDDFQAIGSSNSAECVMYMHRMHDISPSNLSPDILLPTKLFTLRPSSRHYFTSHSNASVD
jgi:hypothetical protein